jgi:hypothetical protein
MPIGEYNMEKTSDVSALASSSSSDATATVAQPPALADVVMMTAAARNLIHICGRMSPRHYLQFKRSIPPEWTRAVDLGYWRFVLRRLSAESRTWRGLPEWGRYLVWVWSPALGPAGRVAAAWEGDVARHAVWHADREMPRWDVVGSWLDTWCREASIRDELDAEIRAWMSAYAVYLDSVDDPSATTTTECCSTCRVRVPSAYWASDESRLWRRQCLLCRP